MSSRRVAALLVLSGVIVAVSCGSDDDSRQPPPAAQAGDAGAPATVAGSGSGAAPSNGGDGALAGQGGAMPGAGGAGAPSATAGQGGELPSVGGGAGGGENGGETSASGAGGEGGAEADPPLFEDGFDGEQLETVAGSYSVNYVEFAQWDVASGSVDITVLPNGFIDSPGGYGSGRLARGVVVDLNGSTLQNGTLETKTALTFLPGVTYTLRYVLGNARNQTNAVTVSITGLVSETRTQNSVTSFVAYETTFTPLAKVTAKLVFASAGAGDDDGLLLDNVSIRR